MAFRPAGLFRIAIHNSQSCEDCKFLLSLRTPADLAAGGRLASGRALDGRGFGCRRRFAGGACVVLLARAGARPPRAAGRRRPWPSAWRSPRPCPLRPWRGDRTRCRRARPARFRRCRPCGSRAAAAACSRPAAPRSAARCVSNSFVTTSRSCRSCMTRRRAFSDAAVGARPPATPRLAMVMSRSTNGRSSFAFGTVVVRCSWRSSAVAWLRSIAMRCSVTRPSFRCATRCLIVFSSGRGWGLGLDLQPQPRLQSLSLFLRRRRLVEAHAEAQAHRVQDLLDLVQALAAEVLGLEHLGLRSSAPARESCGCSRS